MGIGGAIILGLYLWDIKQDRSRTVKILKTTPLYKEWGAIGGTPSIGNVEPGDNINVLRIRYGKDFMYINIERSDGSTGWIIPDAGVELGYK